MKFLTQRWILPWFKKRLPVISPEEQAVLESGGLWFEKTFFSGKIDWSDLFALPKSTLTDEETAFLCNEVETLCGLVSDWQVSHVDHDLPKAAWDFIKSQRFWGLTLPKEYGGHGFSSIAHSSVIAKLATCSAALAYTVMVPNSLGVSTFIFYYGTQAQRDYYLPRLARGDEVSCFALTSPESGSDATSIRDTGVICREMFHGEMTLGVRLNFNKRYITLAPNATLIGLAFKLSDPDHLIGDTTDYGISLALVPAAFQGVEHETRHSPFGLGFMNGPLRGKNVFIPIDYLIGGQATAGQGWPMMMACLSLGRGLSIPSLCSGISQFALRSSSAYSVIRRQFKQSIGKFEGIQLPLARITALTYLTESVRLFTATAVAEGKRPGVAAAIAKYHLTEIAQTIMIDAMDIHGGSAVQLGPRNKLANLYLATQMNKTVEGANILTRNLIIFGQGVLRCHPNIRLLIKTASMSVSQFHQAFFRQVRFYLKNTVLGFFHGLTGGRLIRVPEHPCEKQIKQLTHLSTTLIVLTDFSLLTIGRDLKRREAISSRLGDLVSYLYLASSVLKRYEDDGRSQDDLLLLKWCLDYCLYQSRKAIDDFTSNFPLKKTARWIKWLLFPWGLRYTAPLDALSKEIAEKIQSTITWRDRLSSVCFLGKETDQLSQMDRALAAILSGDPDAEQWRELLIQVDEFRGGDQDE